MNNEIILVDLLQSNREKWNKIKAILIEKLQKNSSFDLQAILGASFPFFNSLKYKYAKEYVDFIKIFPYLAKLLITGKIINIILYVY